eukprot:CAMPEP_0194222106 /NCGR_PEP_ID=MMETSP0156-20130528/32155_1 /TAXON_ID=33649 /ORGANISM="Thalassionema nitzschioides, Strain L26-B" /LENGTH=462 /DNA_ID=CAMNT_0038952751 /DNA_START=416 /DNA_END=1804 /DNA_ORIENTATION=-
METDIIVTLVRILINSKSYREEDILKIIQQIRTMICFENNEATAKNVVDANGIEFLMSLLGRYDSPTLQQEAICILSKLCCSSVSDEVLHYPDFLPQMIDLLRSPESKVRLEVVSFVKDVTFDSIDIRDQLLDLQAATYIIENIRCSQDDLFIAEMCSALSSLSQGNPQPSIDRIKHIVYGTVGIIIHKSLYCTFDMSNIHALRCLATLSNIQNDLDSMEYIFKIGAVPLTQRIVQLLVDNKARSQEWGVDFDTELWAPAIETLCNFCYGPETFVRAVIGAGVFAILPEALGENSTKDIRQMACNLTRQVFRKKAVDIESLKKTKDIKTLALGANSLRVLFDLSKVGSTGWGVRREAIMASATIALASNSEQIAVFVAQGGIETLTEALSIKIDCHLVVFVLAAIEKILSIGKMNGSVYGLIMYQAGGVEMVEHLANDGSESVSEKAESIFEQFFGDDTFDV